MLKRYLLLIGLTLCLLATNGCDPNEDIGTTTKESTEASTPESATASEAVTTEEPVSETISLDEIAAAETAALKYYEDTVFTVNTLTLKYASENRMVFTVHVSKNGEIQEMPRTLELKKVDGVWVKENEGF